MAREHVPSDGLPHESAPRDATVSHRGAADSQRRWLARGEAATDISDDADEEGWGSDRALAQQLLAAAFSDVAPCGVRERVLAAVDAILIEQSAVVAFPADAAPVTTLSGVFEKRRPGAGAASCVEAALDGAAVDRADGDGASVEGLAVSSSDALTPGSLTPGSPTPEGLTPEGDALDADILDGVSLDAMDADGPLEWANEGRAVEPRPGVDGEFVRWRRPLGEREVVLPSSAAGPVAALGAGASHCHGGPMLGRRCRSVPIPRDLLQQTALQQQGRMGRHTPGAVAANPALAGSIAGIAATDLAKTTAAKASAAKASAAKATASTAAASTAAASKAVVPASEPQSRRGASRILPARADLAEDRTPSNFGTAFAVSERTLAPEAPRLRDSMAARASNLAQLAAAIVVGIVIGKAAHLVMAEESASAWSSASDAANALRAEPSRARGPADSGDALEFAAREDARQRVAVSKLEGAGLRIPALDSPEFGATAIDAVAGVTAAIDAAGVDASVLTTRDTVGARGRRAAPPLRARSKGRALRASATSAAALRSSPSRAVSSRAVSSRAVLSSAVLSPAVLSPAEAAGAGTARTMAVPLASVQPAAPCTVPVTTLALPRAPMPAVPVAFEADTSACGTSVAALAQRPSGVGSAARTVPASRRHAPGISIALLDPTSDDWLGEQLAILARAERGLLEGDPESAVRSLDEYQARFPNGLLDPQMASVRQRVQDRFTAFIFP